MLYHILIGCSYNFLVRCMSVVILCYDLPKRFIYCVLYHIINRRTSLHGSPFSCTISSITVTKSVVTLAWSVTLLMIESVAISLTPSLQTFDAEGDDTFITLTTYNREGGRVPVYRLRFLCGRRHNLCVH